MPTCIRRNHGTPQCGAIELTRIDCDAADLDRAVATLGGPDSDNLWDRLCKHLTGDGVALEQIGFYVVGDGGAGDDSVDLSRLLAENPAHLTLAASLTGAAA